MDRALTGSFLAKQLASCDRKTRDGTIRTFKKWLPMQQQVPEEEMKKIWKGLFYCVWHADKQPVQLLLINRLTSLLVSLDLAVSLQYIEVFLATMRREWSGIDFLRLDKFYLLFRRFMHNLFLLLKKNSWDLGLLTSLMSVLEERTLLADDKYPAQGVNYHISEIFLDELKVFLPIRREALDALLSPFFAVMMKSADKVQLNKIKTSMFGRLLSNGSKLLEIRKAGEDVDSRDEVVLFGTIALNLGLHSKFFDMGSSSGCLQGNRKVLFALHKEFLKLASDLENAGIEIPYPHVDDDNSEEVPDLIPVTGQNDQAAEVCSEPVEVVANGFADNPSKKAKKAKKALDGSGKRTKKRKKNNTVVPDSIVLENGTTLDEQSEVVDARNEKNSNDDSEMKDEDNNNVAVTENCNGNMARDENSIELNATVISNLQMQFEKVAAEVGMGEDGMSSLDLPTAAVSRTASKKRKRSKSKDGQGLCTPGAVEGSVAGKSGEKSSKKVRFSMKNNLVWKPDSALPPQSLRLPPSTTPRGSALKKGIPAGPIREIPPTTKRVKLKTSSVKKGRKAKKSVLPAIKQLRMLRSLSV